MKNKSRGGNMNEKLKNLLKFVVIVMLSFIVGAFIGGYLVFNDNYKDCEQHLLSKYNCYVKPIYDDDNPIKDLEIIASEPEPTTNSTSTSIIREEVGNE